MTFSCPTCGDDVRTRVLADPVTLVVVGHCAEHGVQEVSRVYVGQLDETAPVMNDDDVATYPEAAQSQPRVLASAYRPGACCGLRLGEWAWCRLPADHVEPHAA